MFVMTVDQKGSRVHGDQVEPLLAELDAVTARWGDGVVRPWERTVGDEVQAVLQDPAAVVDVALHLVRRGGWSVGVGAGPVDRPLPPSTRAGSGAAFVRARDAVDRAKGRHRAVPVAVEAGGPGRGADAEAVLVLLGVLVQRRSPAGWQVVDALTSLGDEATQADVAARLGITQQAVSQRLRAALWTEERAARPALARLLTEGDR